MTFNAESIAENIRVELEELIEQMCGGSDVAWSADEIERHVWWSLLCLGRQLLQLFFTSRSEQEAQQKTVEVAGIEYHYVGTRQRQYWSIFGKMTIKRRGYWQAGMGNVYPLDASLNLPQRQYSYRLQAWLTELSTGWAYETVQEHLQNWFRLSLPKKSLQTVLQDQAGYHASYVTQQAAPAIPAEDCLLVVQADGKGIPMTATHSPPPEQRRQPSSKTASKEATVTAIYTTAPYDRSPESIIQALLRDPVQTHERALRPTPHHKRIAATLSAQAAAIEQLQGAVTRYSADTLTHRVALCDGNRGLQNRLREYLPDFTLVLDIFHVSGYLWQAVDALFGSQHHPRRYDWMRDALSCLLNNELDLLLAHLHHHMGTLPPARAYTVHTTIRYLENQREHMHYHAYLAQGYPIGSGIIEGACCHLIHDRFEQSGMRWSPTGAQAMLDMRAILLNKDWQDFQVFYRFQEHRKLFPFADPPDTSAPVLAQQAA